MAKIKPLRNSDVFSSLSDREIALLSRIVTVEECQSGTVLLAKNMKSEAFYLICEGQVEISDEDGDSAECLTLSDGDTFGEWSLLGPKHLSTVSARVNKLARILVIKVLDFEKFSEEEPAVALKVQRGLLIKVWDSVYKLKDIL